MFRKTVCLPAALAATMAAAAEPEPVWELGFGLGSYMAPHYLGSDQAAAYVLPIPFLVYRGKRLRADRGGLLSRIYDSDVMDIRLNVSGSLPVNSEDNRARAGMPDLDLMIEAGPTLQFHLYEQHSQQLRFDLPLRAAFSVGHGMVYRGLIVNPGFQYAYSLDHWRFKAAIGPVFGSEAVHDYFYEVDRAYVTPWREAYAAESGYTGLRQVVGVSRHYGDVYASLSLNYYNLHNASNEQSPLMRQDDYLSLSFALVWIFEKSDRLVTF